MHAWSRADDVGCLFERLLWRDMERMTDEIRRFREIIVELFYSTIYA